MTYAQNVRTLENVGFEWDEDSKAGINFHRHGVRMPEAIPVFDDPYAVTVSDDESDPNERRFVAKTSGIISARPAEPHEREEYEAEP